MVLFKYLFCFQVFQRALKMSSKMSTKISEFKTSTFIFQNPLSQSDILPYSCFAVWPVYGALRDPIPYSPIPRGGQSPPHLFFFWGGGVTGVAHTGAPTNVTVYYVGYNIFKFKV